MALSGRQHEVLAKQLLMNHQTWPILQQYGVTEDSDPRLDFLYRAPSERQADELARFLHRETDYDVWAESSGGGFLRKKSWVVTGTTRPTKISQEILDQWVTWMVAAGFENGCEFDGWGAQAPG